LDILISKEKFPCSFLEAKDVKFIHSWRMGKAKRLEDRIVQRQQTTNEMIIKPCNPSDHPVESHLVDFTFLNRN